MDALADPPDGGRARAAVFPRTVVDPPRGLRFVPDRASERPLPDLVAAQVGRDAPGRQGVPPRLPDLVPASTLRAWFDHPRPPVPARPRPTGRTAIAADPAGHHAAASRASRAGG